MIFHESASCYLWPRNIEIMLLGSAIHVANLSCAAGKDASSANEGTQYLLILFGCLSLQETSV